MSATNELRKRIFKPDGTVRGVYYCHASTRRGAVLTVNLGTRPKMLRTSLIVDGRDFNEVYNKCMALVAEWYGVADAGVLADLFTSGGKFLAANNLALRVVSYQQVEPVTIGGAKE